MNFLILDVGTSSMRGILFRGTGEMMNTVQKTYQVITLDHGWVEQNPLDFKNHMTAIVKESAAWAGGAWGDHRRGGDYLPAFFCDSGGRERQSPGQCADVAG